ncbi:MAG: FadR/GntR family transcriptional regulator [Chloroflexota bacterium]
MKDESVVTTATLKRQTRQKSLHIKMVDQIRDLIKRGELIPGDQLLPERDLAETFGVSRPSVRQALAVLESMGVIEITPRDGAYVRRPNIRDAMEPLTHVLFLERDQVDHLFEIRQIIETQAACLAARRCDEADIKRLRHLNQEFQTGLHQDDLAFQTNRDFHNAIIETAKNPLLTEMMTSILAATMEVYIAARQQSLPKSGNMQRFVDEHEQIIQAIEQHDEDTVAELLSKHIDGARYRVEEVLQEIGQ